MVALPSSDDAAARGIAAHAFVGLRAWGALSGEARAYFEFGSSAGEVFEPDLSTREHYDRQFAVFSRLHGALRATGLYDD